MDGKLGWKGEREGARKLIKVIEAPLWNAQRYSSRCVCVYMCVRVDLCDSTEMSPETLNQAGIGRRL